MHRILFILLLINIPFAFAQRKEKVPSYFGIQIRPVFPTKFIGDSYMSLQKDGFETEIQQKTGYSFGGTVRAGITKLIALETGINYTKRRFDITMAVPDSNSYAKDDLSFIEYDIPVNALMYIQLSQEFYMNASIGAIISFKPSDVGIFNQPGGYHSYRHTGYVKNKLGFGVNANFGFEYRTKESGFFYVGGSARVPFAPLFTLIAEYSYQGVYNKTFGDVDGSFLTIDFKYFFPNIKNKGVQFNDGPVEN